jgi:hypothetical protein
LFLSPSFEDPQRKIRTAADAEPAAVAFNGLDRARVSLVIRYKHIVRAQLHANAAALAPLVKNIERDLWILALLLFFSIFDFGLF